MPFGTAQYALYGAGTKAFDLAQVFHKQTGVDLANAKEGDKKKKCALLSSRMLLCYAIRGTKIAYGHTIRAALNKLRTAAAQLKVPPFKPPSDVPQQWGVKLRWSWCAAMSGTELAYGAT
eukprot:435313-Rhodomonas_salina.1